MTKYVFVCIACKNPISFDRLVQDDNDDLIFVTWCEECDVEIATDRPEIHTEEVQ